MKLIVDMNLPPGWLGFLAANRIEAVHWSTVRGSARSDAAIMKWALDRGYGLFTHDVDFTAILALAGAPARAWFRSAPRLRAWYLWGDGSGCSVTAAGLR